LTTTQNTDSIDSVELFFLLAPHGERMKVRGGLGYGKKCALWRWTQARSGNETVTSS